MFSYPKLPSIVESKAVSPNTDHPPNIENDDRDCNNVEHSLIGKPKMLLTQPERADPGGLFQVTKR